ncbi:tetratricopeptide repeat protein [Alteromonas marina]|jgi:tetratricopeptide (TPR) repeat protein|nr:tetratricopeptide repeat protein [Alteromonas marina]
MAIQFKTQISAPHIAGLIGIVYLELTRYEDARNYLLEAYDFSKKKNNALIQGRFAEKIALVEYELLNADSSEKYFDQAIEIAQRSKDTPLLARSLLGKGKMLLRLADKEKSIEVVRSYYETALLLASNLDNKALYFDALLALSKLALSNGDIDIALTMY